MNEELDRLTASLSALIDQQNRQLDQGIRTMADALRHAADRVAALTPGAAAAPGPVSPVVAAPPAVATATGVLAVRVVNDSSSPIPVLTVKASESKGGFWGVVSGIAGGIGSLVGGLVGGFLGGGIGGPIMGAELIIALAQLGPLLDKLDGILNRFYAFGRLFMTELKNVINLLFGQLTAAGIFPVSRLFASLLLFIDLGISVVLAHLRVVINWVEQLFTELVSWLGKFINALGTWIGQILSRVGPFLRDLLAYLLERVVRPYVAIIVRDAIRSAVESLAAVLLGSAFAIGGVIVESLKFAWDWALNKLAELINHIPGVSVPVPPPPAPLGPAISKAISDGFTSGRGLAEAWTRGILGAPGSSPAPGTPGAPPAAPTAPPTFSMPGFKSPELNLPEFPEVTPQLEKLLNSKPPATPPSTTTPTTSPLTLNGGVHVSIATDSVDREHADETARQLARGMLDELRRLAERERFRVGLPTAFPS